MGMPGPWELLIILAIVALVFGTKKLRNMGSDVGSMVKGYQNAMKGDDSATAAGKDGAGNNEVIEGEVDTPPGKEK